VYLSFGLVFLLFFIGVKLILYVLYENELFFVNGGCYVEWVFDIFIWLLLVVIVGMFVVFVVGEYLCVGVFDDFGEGVMVVLVLVGCYDVVELVGVFVDECV